MPLEIEIKFYLTDIQRIRNRIFELKAVSSGRVFEQNVRFEDSDGSLTRKKSLLRLRQDARTRLTFKSEPPPENRSNEFKIFQELELEVSDFDTMTAILEALGFHREQVLCLDTMPFGDFLEIEGEPDDIRNLADALGLPWEDRILKNYLGMFESLRQGLDLQFSDITFDNFKSVNADMTPFFRNYRAGS